MKDKILSIIKSPVLAVVLLISGLTIGLFAYAAKNTNEIPSGDTSSVLTKASENKRPLSSEMIFSETSKKAHTTSLVTTKKTTTTSTTTVTTTIATTAEVTTVVTEAPTEAPQPEPQPEPEPDPEPQDTAPQPTPGQPLSPYLHAGVSPNSAFYQERLAILGDSIATGYSLYGYIPSAHSIARESVGLWNIHNYTFNFGYGDMNVSNAVAYMQPQIIMLSIGMNDLPNRNPEWFAGLYSAFVSEVLAAAPNTYVICAGITPVADYVTYSTNENIRSYNAAIENMVNSMNSPQVYYFDAYSVLADSNTLALSPANSGGDGIHIGSGSYNSILTALFNFLDTTPIMENLTNQAQ
ncbi:MAG: SGNH/GDSL hydrolase family protein [Ruminococcus sp.]|nr:SGNH/GDSL hydrolase family protein [Ruminococcus sp.]